MVDVYHDGGRTRIKLAEISIRKPRNSLLLVHRKAVKGSKAVPMQREDAMVLEKPMETEYDQEAVCSRFQKFKSKWKDRQEKGSAPK